MSLRDSSYFDLSEILVTQERIPCQVNPNSNPIKGLGFLDPTFFDGADDEEDNDLQPDTKLELPLWMVVALSRRAKLHPNSFEVTVPDIYALERRKGQLRADPTVLTLPRCGPAHFYATGVHLLKFSILQDSRGGTQPTPDEELGAVLVSVLRKRFRQILDSSFHADECDTPSEMAKLDMLERKLYESGLKSQRQLRNWFIRRTALIRTSSMIQRHRKRKADLLS